jgi:hypothetical protein
MSEELKELYFRIIQLSDEELLQMVNVEYDEYRPEALKFAREELNRRGLPIEPSKTSGPPQPNADAAVEGGTPEPSSNEAELDGQKSVVQGNARDAEALPEVRFEIFRSGMSSWESLFTEAADFASQIGPEDLINISHSEDSNEGIVTVWYWYR